MAARPPWRESAAPGLPTTARALAASDEHRAERVVAICDVVGLPRLYSAPLNLIRHPPRSVQQRSR